MAVVDRYLPEHQFRLAVKPGLTGPMQVFGRGDLTFQERLAVELDYVENVSLGRDLRILFQTVPAIIRGTGAF
jgi:lipopolysaccharide/colanic/teichoic acid biosynthesis glycosyltransferase